MFKKIFMVFVMCIVSLSLLVGCGQPKADNNNQKESDKTTVDKSTDGETSDNCEFCSQEYGHAVDCKSLVDENGVCYECDSDDGHFGYCSVYANNTETCGECGITFGETPHEEGCSMYTEGDGDVCVDCGEVNHLEFCPSKRAGQEYDGTRFTYKPAPNHYMKINDKTVPATVDVGLVVSHYVDQLDIITEDERVNKDFVRNEAQYFELAKAMSGYLDAQLKELGCPPLGFNIYYQLLHNKIGYKSEYLSYPSIMLVEEPTNKLEELIYEYVDNTDRYDRNSRVLGKILTDNGYPVYITNMIDHLFDYRIKYVHPYMGGTGI